MSAGRFVSVYGLMAVGLSLAWMGFASPASAGSVGAPTINPDDSWVYREMVERNGAGRQIHNELTVVHTSSMGILVSVKEVGATLLPKEVMAKSDWSRVRNINGEDVVVNKPLDFPLSVGKTWALDYSEDNPNKLQKNERVHVQYTVAGDEHVTVPAGTFSAVKIESEGRWTAVIQPAAVASTITRKDDQGAETVAAFNNVAEKTVGGRLYKAFWYVPEVKRFVKSVEEYYGPNGNLSERYTSELESYKLAP